METTPKMSEHDQELDRVFEDVLEDRYLDGLERWLVDVNAELDKLEAGDTQGFTYLSSDAYTGVS